MQNTKLFSLLRLALASLLLLSLGAIATVQAQAPASDSSMEGGAGSLRSALDSDWQLDEHSLSRAPTRRCRILARSSAGLAAMTTEMTSRLVIAPAYRSASTGSRPTWTPSSSGLVHAA